jgi:ABC-type amino acid transport substrate-binding protein
MTMAMLFASGCGASGDSNGDSNGDSGAVSRIKDAGVVKIGTIVTPPWVNQAPGEKGYTGSEPLYMDLVAKELGVKIEWVPSSWDTIIQGLASKQYDIAAAPLNPSPEREKVASFSNFTEAGYCYLVQDGSTIKEIADINSSDVKVSAPSGSPLVDLMKKTYPKAKVTAVALPPGANTNVEDILTGRYDVAILNSPEVYAYEAKFGGELRMVPAGDECYNSPDLPSPIGAAVRKDETDLLDVLKEVYAANKKEIDAENIKATREMKLG